MSNFFSRFFYGGGVITSTGGSGFSYEVDTLQELTTNHPANTNTNRYALVKTTTLLPFARAGRYQSNGTDWVRIPYSVTIVNNLNSNVTTSALSANMGRELREHIERTGGTTTANNIERVAESNTVAVFYLGKSVTTTPLVWAVRRLRIEATDTVDMITSTIARSTTDTTYTSYEEAWDNRTLLTYM